MTDLPVENKQNWILEFFKSVWKFILKLLGLDGEQGNVFGKVHVKIHVVVKIVIVLLLSMKKKKTMETLI